MLATQEYINSIRERLAFLKSQVEISSRINLYDIHIHSEYFYKDFLNLLYGYKLNTLEKNATAIDLGDKKNKIAFQVTSDSSSNKIHETIKKFIEKKLYNDYNELNMLILTEKQDFKRVKFDTKGYFVFSADKNIWDIHYIIESKIRGMVEEELKIVKEFLEKNIGLPTREIKATLSNQVQTIIQLIEYLSKEENQKPVEVPSEKEPDPNKKINSRFSEHSNFLINEYKNNALFYAGSLKEAKSVLGLDSVKAAKIQSYLKDISNRFLWENGNNPRLALGKLADYFEKAISENGKGYDPPAIKFYLIDELIKCNVFPNEEN
jgi:hypothetical protein